MATRPRLTKMEIERRNSLILEMVESGAKYGSVALALERGSFGRLSKSRISEIVNKELEQIRRQRTDLAERMFDLKITQLDSVIRTNWGVINAKCGPCQGKGDRGQDPDKPEGTLLVCDKCHGDGKHHNARDRASASKEIRQAIDQQCKMLGLYAPEKFALTDPQGHEIEFWQNETRSLDEDDLDKELAIFQAGVDAARKERKAAKETASGPHEDADSRSGADAG